MHNFMLTQLSPKFTRRRRILLSGCLMVLCRKLVVFSFVFTLTGAGVLWAGVKPQEQFAHLNFSMEYAF